MSDKDDAVLTLTCLSINWISHFLLLNNNNSKKKPPLLLNNNQNYFQRTEVTSFFLKLPFFDFHEILLVDFVNFYKRKIQFFQNTRFKKKTWPTWKAFELHKKKKEPSRLKSNSKVNLQKKI